MLIITNRPPCLSRPGVPASIISPGSAIIVNTKPDIVSILHRHEGKFCNQVFGDQYERRRIGRRLGLGPDEVGCPKDAVFAGPGDEVLHFSSDAAIVDHFVVVGAEVARPLEQPKVADPDLQTQVYILRALLGNREQRAEAMEKDLIAAKAEISILKETVIHVTGQRNGANKRADAAEASARAAAGAQGETQRLLGILTVVLSETRKKLESHKLVLHVATPLMDVARAEILALRAQTLGDANELAIWKGRAEAAESEVAALTSALEQRHQALNTALKQRQDLTLELGNSRELAESRLWQLNSALADIAGLRRVAETDQKEHQALRAQGMKDAEEIRVLRGNIAGLVQERDGLRRDGVPEIKGLQAIIRSQRAMEDDLKETVSHVTRERDGARDQVAALEKSFAEYKLGPNAQRYSKLRRYWVQIGYSDTQLRLGTLDLAVDALPDQPTA